EGHARTSRHHVVRAGIEPPLAFAANPDDDAIRGLQLDLVVEREREGERIEAWTQVRGARRDADANAHGGENTRFPRPRPARTETPPRFGLRGAPRPGVGGVKCD